MGNNVRLSSGGKYAHVAAAARDSTPVSGLTHNFYRYPARFSPSFPRALIKALSKPGDWILDPFAGGGTTLVEAMALGRNVVGSDISSLSAFVCEAKTTVMSDIDERELHAWISYGPACINMRAPGKRFNEYANEGYYRNISGPSHWRLRKAIEQSLVSLDQIEGERARTLARCAILRTSQWAMDTRKEPPDVEAFKRRLGGYAQEILDGATKLRKSIEKYDRTPVRIIANMRADALGDDRLFKKAIRPKLIVTSPPYPGIHVLYHRWQINGGKEAPAPFWIANRLDGSGSSHYTMGDRKDPAQDAYFENLAMAFRSIAKVCSAQTTIAQMVAFSDPKRQLPRYLAVMEHCGFRELLPWGDDDADEEGRLWREVPNRKWHARRAKKSPGAREVVLLHRLAK
jgi:hypothetical protein